MCAFSKNLRLVRLDFAPSFKLGNLVAVRAELIESNTSVKVSLEKYTNAINLSVLLSSRQSIHEKRLLQLSEITRVMSVVIFSL